MAMAVPEKYAERNIDFIINVLQVLTEQKMDEPREVDSERPQDSVSTNAGVYVLFANRRGDRPIPIYIGITSRSFKQRFREHARNGVIQKFNDQELHLVTDTDIRLDRHFFFFFFFFFLNTSKYLNSQKASVRNNNKQQ